MTWGVALSVLDLLAIIVGVSVFCYRHDGSSGGPDEAWSWSKRNRYEHPEDYE